MKKQIILTMVVVTSLSGIKISTKANTQVSTTCEQLKPVFNSNDIRGVAQVTSEQLRNVVPNTMKELINDIIYYSNLYEVNAFAVTGIIRQESGNNTSRISKSHNNLGGIVAGNGYKYFDSKSECIEYMVKLLKNDYLSRDGRYFNGYSLRAINENYCPNDDYYWSSQVELMANKMCDSIER